MSAEAEAESEQGDATAEVSFDPADVRRRLPNEATDRQTRALVCAVRNPEASPYEIAVAAGVEASEVVRTLENLANGVLTEPTDHHRQVAERRNTRRHAENYHELTDKQRAIVDYRARYDPEFELSGAAVGRSINARDDYDVSLDVTTVPSFENGPYADRLGEFVAERRNVLTASGDLDADETTADAAAHRLDTREYLDLAGYETPESNLDSLERVGDGLDDESRLDLAFERASELDDDTEGGEQAARQATVRPTEVLDVRAARSFEDDDVRVGVPYLAEVNGVVEWGVWFTLSGDPSSPDDVSGVVPIERLREHGREPGDYAVGDTAVVIPTGRSNVDDGKVRHRLRLATVETGAQGEATDAADGPQGEADEGPTDPSGEDADDESGDESDETTTLADERVLELGETVEDLAATVDEQADRIAALSDELYGHIEATADDEDDEDADLAELIRLARSVEGVSLDITLNT